MNLFQMSRLSRLNVKWIDFHKGNSPLSNYEHSNPHFEILMVSEGPIFLQTEDQKWELQSGECFILRPWERHTGWKLTHEQAGFYWVQFEVSPELTECEPDELSSYAGAMLLGKSLQELRIDPQQEAEVERILLPRYFQTIRRYELLSFFEKLHHEMEHPQGYFRYRCSLLLGQILHTIAEDLLNKEHGRTAVPASFTTYRQLVNHLNENYNSDLKRETIEQLLNRKYEYLCQIFKKHSGMSIFTYVHQLRIQRAQYLLANSDYEIKQIAEMVGFQDPYYFSRIFKRLTHCSPTDYRMKRIQAEGLKGER